MKAFIINLQKRKHYVRNIRNIKRYYPELKKEIDKVMAYITGEKVMSK